MKNRLMVFNGHKVKDLLGGADLVWRIHDRCRRQIKDAVDFSQIETENWVHTHP